jgi:hypothetical protein
VPYKVWIGNTPIECETAEDALDLARRADGSGGGGGGTDLSRKPLKRNEAEGSVTPSRWSERRVSDFFALIDGNQRKLIDALLEHADGRTDDQLMALLNLDDGRALGGVLGGVWKNAKKVGADPADLYQKKPATIGGRKAYEYLLSESFRRAAEAHRRGSNGE